LQVGVAGELISKYGAPWTRKKAAAALIGRIDDLIDQAVDGIKHGVGQVAS